jgi:dihydropteroate synthase
MVFLSEMTLALRASLAGVQVGDGLPVAVMGALNVSPESFYAGSVVTRGDALLSAAEAMARAGAALIDVGAMSTAPYRDTRIVDSEEADRLAWAVGLIASKLDIPVSADTSRSAAARAALQAGARIINDVTGLTGDAGMAGLVAGAGADLVVMASERGRPRPGRPIQRVRALLAESLGIAERAGIPLERIVVDPGIGFFRDQGMAWHEWDCRVLAGLGGLRDLGRPLCVGVSRKSFIGAIAGAAEPADRLAGSLAAAAAAVLGGAHLIRAHDVAETVQAVRVAQAIRRASLEG